MQPVPILLLARELGIGGSERQLAEVARSLDHTRFQVHAACFRPGGFRAAELQAAGIEVHHLPVQSFRDSSAIGGARALRRLVRERGIRLLHSFDYPSTVFAIPMARLLGSAGVSSQRCERSLIPQPYLRLVRWTDRWARKIVVNSEFIRRQMIAEENVPAERIELCYNGLDARSFPPAPPRNTEEPIIGTVAALRPEKGLRTLVDAFALVRKQRPDARLRIVGDGELRPILARQASRLGLDASVDFEPATSAVAPRLHTMDIFVLPSLSEAFSNSLMEAMACECAVIASRVGGNPELVKHGETGLLFTSGDAEDLARQILTLLDDPELRSRVARCGSARIRSGFSLEQAAARMGEIYQGVLA